jgi:hypothetical protein
MECVVMFSIVDGRWKIEDRRLLPLEQREEVERRKEKLDGVRRKRFQILVTY